MRSIWPAAALTLGLGFLHGAGAQGFFTPSSGVESAAYDVHYTWRARLKPAPPPDERLLLLAYDEQTRELEAGRSSGYHVVADALEKLADARARLVLLDYRLDTTHFAGLGRRLEEIGRSLPASTPPEEASELARIAAELRVDERLAAAMDRVPTVIVFACSSTALEVGGDPLSPMLRKKAHPIAVAEPPQYVRRISRPIAPSPIFLEHAKAVAHSCEFPDVDGILRTDPPVVGVPVAGGWEYFPSVSTALAAEALGLPGEAVSLERSGLRIGNRLLRFDRSGEALLGLSGPGGSFRGRQGKPARHSVLELVRGELPASRVEGRIVLIGDTLATSRDSKLTSFGYGFGARMPGVEKIAMHTDYLVQSDRYLQRPLWATQFGFLLTIALGCVAGWVGARIGFYSALGLVLGGPVIFALGTVALTWGGLWIDSAYPAIAWSTGMLSSALVRYAQQMRERRALERAFERYVPKEMVRAILRDPGAAKLMGEERQMTVLFADLRGFTTYSEGHSAREVVSHLNEHLTLMSDVIQKHGGTVDKFIGDAVMAFWGAPLPDADHAAHACQAAREMLLALDRRNDERIVRGLPQVDMGIGINSGPMIVGNMGSMKRFNYTVIGDAVNLASRLEGLTKEFHQRVIAGPETVRLASKYFAFRALGEVTVKGKQERVPVFALVEEEASSSSKASPPPARPGRPSGTLPAPRRS